MALRLVLQAFPSFRYEGKIDLVVDAVTDADGGYTSQYARHSFTRKQVCWIEPELVGDNEQEAGVYIKGDGIMSQTIRQQAEKVKAMLTLAYNQQLEKLKREPLGREIRFQMLQNNKPKPVVAGPALTFEKMLLMYLAEHKGKGRGDRQFVENLYPVLRDFLKKEGLAITKYDFKQITAEILFRFDDFLAKRRQWTHGRGAYQTKALPTISPEYQAWLSARLRTLLRFAAKKKEISRDLLWDYEDGKAARPKASKKLVNRLVTADDLKRIEAAPPADLPLALRRIRLMFLLQTWTGMAHIDLFTYDMPNLIQTDLSNRRSLVYTRVKTEEMAIVPVFAQTDEIVRQLEFNCKPSTISDEANARRWYREQCIKLLKFYKVNIETDHPVGAHTGRHVFGERMLDMGFTIEAVSRMMGHATKDQTEKVYAIVDTDKIYADLNRIQQQNQISTANGNVA